jgi:hypothetical protein
MARASGTQALSTTAVRLPAQACTQVAITNNDASIAMLLGWNSTTQSFTLTAGSTVTFRVTNLNNLYAKSASGTPTLSYLTQ